MKSQSKKLAGLGCYVFSYILLITLPFGIMLGLFSSQYFSEYRDLVMNNSKSSLLGIQKSYELIFSQMDTIVEQMGREQEFLSFDVEKNLSITMRLKNRLAGYKASNACYDSILYYKRGGAWLCAHDSTYRMDTYATRVNHMSGITPEEFQSVLNHCTERTVIGPQYEKLYAQAADQFLSFVYPVSMPGDAPRATLVFKLSLSVLEGMLNLRTPDSVYFVTLPSLHGYASVTSDHAFDGFIAKAAERADNADFWSDVTLIDGKNYLISCVYDADTGIRYFYETPESLAMQKLHWQKLLFFSLLLLLSLIEIAGILALGYKRYQPIETLQEFINNRFSRYGSETEKRLPIYGRSIESAKQILQTMDSQQDILEERLLESEAALRDVILYKLVSGGFTSEARLKESLRQAQIHLTRTYICVSVLDCDGVSLEECEQAFQRDLKIEQAYLFHLTATRYIALFSGEFENPGCDKEMFEKAISGLHCGAKRCYLGLGNPVSDSLRLRQSFQQALHSLDYGMKYNQSVTFYMDILSSTHSFFSDYPFFRIQRLRRALIEGDEEECKNDIDEIRCNLQKHIGEYIYVTSLAYDCANTVFSAFLDKNEDALSISESMTLISTASMAQEALTYFEKVAAETQAYFARRKAGQQNAFTEKAVSIIHHNLENYDFSLASLAQELHMTPSNLSQQFKRYMKQTPMEYFNALKIERVKYYLQNTAMTNKQIMEQLGYASEASFVRMFRKRVGITPGEYRRCVGVCENEASVHAQATGPV